MKKSKSPSFKLEKFFWNKNITVFGIDEVGRGSFAGPLVGAAVAFKKNFKKKWLKDIKDSKLLTHKQRVRLSNLIQKHCEYYIETVNVETINKIGIEKSNILLFSKLRKLISNKTKKHHLLIDGGKKLNYPKTTYIIGGDNISKSISAASIIAKVYRDNLMRTIGKEYKGYYFYKNKGYGTKSHIKSLKKYGMTKIHRKSFNLDRYLLNRI